MVISIGANHPRTTILGLASLGTASNRCRHNTVCNLLRLLFCDAAICANHKLLLSRYTTTIKRGARSSTHDRRGQVCAMYPDVTESGKSLILYLSFGTISVALPLKHASSARARIARMMEYDSTGKEAVQGWPWKTRAPVSRRGQIYTVRGQCHRLLYTNVLQYMVILFTI